MRDDIFHSTLDWQTKEQLPRSGRRVGQRSAFIAPALSTPNNRPSKPSRGCALSRLTFLIRLPAKRGAGQLL
jgi:hypothetical protein